MREHIPAAITEWIERAPKIQRLRDYRDGKHLAPFASPKFWQQYRWLIRQSRENLMPACISAFTDLLVIDDWTGEVDTQLRAQMARLAAFINREAFLSGDAYTLTWQAPDGTVRPVFKRGDQVIPVVSDDNPDVLQHAVIPWVASDGFARANIYYPDRLERWRSRLPIRDPGDNVTLRDFPRETIAWVEHGDNEGGPEIGHDFGAVPVVWWKRLPDDPWSHGRSVLTDAIPAQDELNFLKAVTNAAVERIARPIRYALADKPPPEGKVDFDPTREDILGLTARAAGQFDGPDGAQLVALQDKAERSIANIVGIPPYVFSQASGDVPSGEALRVLNSRRTAIVSAFAADSIAPWRGQMELLGIQAEPVFADPMPLTETEAVILAAEEKALGLPVEDWLRTAGRDPEQTDEAGDTLAERVRNGASTDAAAMGKAFRDGAVGF